MEVILREDVQSVGKAGEVVKVRPGYARNFLFPKRLAVEADPRNLKELEHHKRAALAREAKRKQEASALAERIDRLSITIQKEAGEEEKIFGSVTAKEIMEALRKEKIVVDKKQIQWAAPIKQLGSFEVQVKLHSGVTATLKISVVRK